MTMDINRYNRRINGHKYYVKVAEYDWLPLVVVRVANCVYTSSDDSIYAKRREWFCEDIDKFVADVFSTAVQNNEQQIAEENNYDERIEQALDVVKEEYEDST